MDRADHRAIFLFGVALIGTAFACHPSPSALEGTAGLSVADTSITNTLSQGVGKPEGRRDSVALSPVDPEPGTQGDSPSTVTEVAEPFTVEVRVPDRDVAPGRVFYATASLVNRSSRRIVVYHESFLLLLRVYRDGRQVYPSIEYDFDLELNYHFMDPGEYYGGKRALVDTTYYIRSEAIFPVVLGEAGLYHAVATAYFDTLAAPAGKGIRLHSDSVEVIVE